VNPEELLDILTDRYTVYGFYSHGDVIGVSKLPSLVGVSLLTVIANT
jgi:hypothetical protein